MQCDATENVGAMCEERCMFGVQQVSDSAIISSDQYQAQKNSNLLFAPCSFYSACPLSGHSSFEVEVSVVSVRPVGRLMLGITRVPKRCSIVKTALPYESKNYCVWHNSAVWNNLTTVHTKTSYGSFSLADLKSLDRVGFTISLAGDLAFYVNSEFQGLAARNVYLESCDVYAVVTLLESCDSISVTRAGTVNLCKCNVTIVALSLISCVATYFVPQLPLM